MLETFKFDYEALTPISHGDEMNLSTIQPFRRQRIFWDGEYHDIPIVSGNSMRGGYLRRRGMKKFCDLLDLRKNSLKPKQYYLLFNGGSLSKSGEDISIGQKKEFRALLPIVSIFGGAIDNMLLEGRMNIGIIYPIGKETQGITRIPSERSVFEFLDTIFYTRKDDYMPDDPADKTDTVQMKYETEILVPGTQLTQTVTLRTDEELELSAFGFLMDAFLEEPRLGSKGNVGHGYVTFKSDRKIPDSGAFIEYTKQNKDKIVDFIKAM